MKFLIGFIPVASTAVFLISSIATPYMAVSTLAYVCMVTGLIKKKERGLHMTMMSIAIMIDFGIVFSLELSRDAIHTAMSMTLSSLQQMHVTASTVAVLLYFPTIFFGVRRALAIRNRTGGSSKLHQIFGITAFIFRTLGFILMFSLLK